MKDFVAIDFETANEYRSSVCSLGAVLVRNGEIRENFYSLIHPEADYFNWRCQQVHGLGPCDTDCAECFPCVWKAMCMQFFGEYNELWPAIDLPLVAHNSRFDESCLKKVFETYQMDYPDYDFHDTLAASRKHFGNTLPNHQLQTVSAVCGYDLTQHHHALADAEACAYIALAIL